MVERFDGQEYLQAELFPPGTIEAHPNLNKIKLVRSHVVFHYAIEYVDRYPREDLPNPVIHSNYDHELSIDEQIVAVDESYELYENFGRRVAEDPEVLWGQLKEPFT